MAEFIPRTLTKISIIPLLSLPLIQKGDDLVAIIVNCVSASDDKLQDNDILVLSQKIVSKSEGSTVNLEEVTPSDEVLELAEEVGKDPRIVHLILRESKRIVRKAHGVLIVEHNNGWICANAGVDYSNVPGSWVALLPRDPDGTAEAIRKRIRAVLKVEVAVVISDSQGRPFRKGSVGVALGCAGMCGLARIRGDQDLYAYELKTTEAAVADQVASAALLVMGESNEGVPAAIVRGLGFRQRDGNAKALIRSKEEDLFR